MSIMTVRRFLTGGFLDTGSQLQLLFLISLCRSPATVTSSCRCCLSLHPTVRSSLLQAHHTRLCLTPSPSLFLPPITTSFILLLTTISSSSQSWLSGGFSRLLPSQDCLTSLLLYSHASRSLAQGGGAHRSKRHSNALRRGTQRW